MSWFLRLIGLSAHPPHEDPEVRYAQQQTKKAEENAKSAGEQADDVKSQLRRHRQENHFSDLIDSVLRGDR